MFQKPNQKTDEVLMTRKRGSETKKWWPER
jgi:hypothetical protein